MTQVKTRGLDHKRKDAQDEGKDSRIHIQYEQKTELYLGHRRKERCNLSTAVLLGTCRYACVTADYANGGDTEC